MPEADAVLLARAQFAFTIGFHIVLPAFTIGLASYLAVLEALWVATGRQVYRDVFQYWLRVFAVAFGMGVVSGLVLVYEFGINWARFSDKTGAVIGPLMGELTVPFLGPERATWQYPFGGIHRTGGRLVMGSDWPVRSIATSSNAGCGCSPSLSAFVSSPAWC